jgi:predicted CopG family antitoxin
MKGTTMKIVISNDAYNALAALNVPGYRGDGERRPDGQWSIQLTTKTLTLLDGLRAEGESYSDVILQLVTFHTLGDGKLN